MPEPNHRYIQQVDFTAPRPPSGPRSSTLPGSHPASLGSRRLTMEPPPLYPGAMVNVTNHCNLRCKHCFVFREGNPNQPEGEMKPERVLSELQRLRDRHGIRFMMWMGGEPMLRWRTVEKGISLFHRNHITTNGTVPLKDFGPDITYVISLDGPREVNDAVRGAGVFDMVMKTIAAIPERFPLRRRGPVRGAPGEPGSSRGAGARAASDQGPWPDLQLLRAPRWRGLAQSLGEQRGAREVIDLVFDLKRRYPGFIWNSSRSLDLMRPATAKLVTDHCPMMQTMLPLYIEGDHFTTPFCCYGNDVDCDRCGSWGVFAAAAKNPGPWDSPEV